MLSSWRVFAQELKLIATQKVTHNLRKILVWRFFIELTLKAFSGEGKTFHLTS
jgi:hypothetical protein